MTLSPPALRINEPDVTADFSDDDAVLINLRNGRYYRVEGPGLRALRALSEAPAHELIVVEDVARPELERFARLLVDRHLLAGDVERCRFGPLGDSESGGQTLDLEEYGDLEDLLGLDPIHDVEPMKGWPVRASDA